MLEKISTEQIKPCIHFEHYPPANSVLEPGTYKHTCTNCGGQVIFTVDFNQVYWKLKSESECGNYQEMVRIYAF